MPSMPASGAILASAAKGSDAGLLIAENNARDPRLVSRADSETREARRVVGHVTQALFRFASGGSQRFPFAGSLQAARGHGRVAAGHRYPARIQKAARAQSAQGHLQGYQVVRPGE